MDDSEPRSEVGLQRSFARDANAAVQDPAVTEGAGEHYDVESEVDPSSPDAREEDMILNEETSFTIFEDADANDDIKDDENNASSSHKADKPEEPPNALTASISAPSFANLADDHETNEAMANENTNAVNLSPERIRPSSKASTPHKSSCNTTPFHIQSFSMTNTGPVCPLQMLNRQYTSPYSGPVAWTVPKRGSTTRSTPFTIYEDPPWYEPSSPEYDETSDLEASDDKENAYPTQQQQQIDLLSNDGDPDDSSSSDGTTTPIENAIFEAENLIELAARNARSRATPDPFGTYAARRLPLVPLAVFSRPEGPHRLASEMELSAEVDAVMPPARARALRRLRGHSDLRAWARVSTGEGGGEGDRNIPDDS